MVVVKSMVVASIKLQKKKVVEDDDDKTQVGQLQ